jgi:AcrR family transcriptional regulator
MASIDLIEPYWYFRFNRFGHGSIATTMPRRAATPAVPPAKAEAILRAATALFSRYGVRKTSMELIAAEAGVAKPTVYAHYADKDALFVAVCEQLTSSIVAAAERAAAGEGDLLARLSAMLEAKFTTVFELVDSSPHARELLASTDSMAKSVIAAADARYEELLVGALRSATKKGELDLQKLAVTPKAFAAMLMQAGAGAGHHATSVEQHRKNLRALVRALVAAARA